jgi:23S rRNA pseudouridine1911/1915/1917 synthase
MNQNLSATVDDDAELVELWATMNGSGCRLDAWLAEQLPDFSRSRLQKLIEQGQVLVNGKPTDKKYKLQGVEQVSVRVPPPQPLDLVPENIPLDILYEDDQMLILNKAAGMVVHPSAGHETGTLVHALLAHCPLSAIGGVQRPGIVHRLDRDTTGVMVVAKTDFAHQHLQAQIQSKVARREYLGVVSGAPQEPEGIVDLPIGRHPVDRQKQSILPIEAGGRSAQTHWQVLERLGDFTLVKFRLATGRTHQIRVHSTRLGYPIVGDPLYGNARSIKVNLPGQALHAWQLELTHPLSGAQILAEAPLPPHFEKLLAVLRSRQGRHW